jgi:hypothetical protein
MMIGGSVEAVEAHGSSSIAIIGGSIGVALYAFNSSILSVAGTGLEVDGVPVPYGDLAATAGTLTGTLASGDPVGNVFHRGPSATITLVPGDDGDGDLIPDALDNCPTIPNGPSQDNQADQDADDVGDVCDNCVLAYNPRATYPAYRTTTGGQLDNDAEGYGNVCDCEFTLVAICTSLDTIQYKAAINKPVWASNCGSPPIRPCDKFDLDGKDPVISALDTIRFKQLLHGPIGPKCAACPLECVGDACPPW